MSLPVKVKCPFLEQSKDVKALGESQPETRNFFSEVNSALEFVAAGRLQLVNDEGVYQAVALFLNSAPEVIRDGFSIGEETWTFREARAAAFQITANVAVDVNLTNAAAAVNLDTEQNIFAEADLDNDLLIIWLADAPGGDPIPGHLALTISETFRDGASVWSQDNFGAIGRAPYRYQAPMMITATAENIATPFTVTVPFAIELLIPIWPNHTKTIEIGEAGYDLLAPVTATAVANGSEIACDFGAGTEPLVPTDVVYLLAFGNPVVQ